MTLGRMWETPAVKPHEEILLIMEEGVVPTSGGEAILRASKGEALRSPLQVGDPDVIEEGRAQYFLYCAQCHGRYHDGNGTVGQSFHPLPTDLRGERVQSLPEGVIFKEISYGIPKPDNRQPPLATTIDIPDRWRIVAYLKSLGPRK
jgi:mono/diheme cytochrome c family protein